MYILVHDSVCVNTDIVSEQPHWVLDVLNDENGGLYVYWKEIDLLEGKNQ